MAFLTNIILFKTFIIYIMFAILLLQQERHSSQRTSTFSKLTHLFRLRDSNDNASSAGSVGSGFRPYRRSISRTNSMNIIGSTLPPTPRSPPPQSDTLRGFHSFFGKHQKQYTIASKKKYVSLVVVYLGTISLLAYTII